MPNVEAESAEDGDPTPGGATDLVIDSREGLERALVAALDEAAGQAGPTQLWLCDSDFAAWPLGQPRVVEAFARWARSRNRLTLLAASYAGFAQRVPRWMAWRRQWSHIVHCLAVHEEVAAGVPTLFYAPRLVALRLHDRERYRGRSHRSPLELTGYAELLDALSQRAEEGLPVTTLGL